MKPEKFSLRSRIKSFEFAFRGIGRLLKNEHNSRIHFTVAFVVIVLGFVLRVSSIEWICLSIAMALVILSELFNTSIELLADKVESEYDKTIGAVKDLASAAVLIASILSVIVGLIIFTPKILELF